MKFEPGKILSEVVLITLQPFCDARGSFTRTYCKEEFVSAGLPTFWVQCNHTVTAKKGAIRGMHWQSEPKSEGKLVRCLEGKVFDVVVDIRSESPSFGKWEAFELSPSANNQLFIPEGFAHGFQCLTDNCHLFYQMTEYYAPELAWGLRYDCAEVGIDWPLPLQEISERDFNLPTLPEIR